MTSQTYTNKETNRYYKAVKPILATRGLVEFLHCVQALPPPPSVKFSVLTFSKVSLERKSSLSIDHLGTAKVTVTALKKPFVICGEFSKHILYYCCVKIVVTFDEPEGGQTKRLLPASVKARG